MTSTRTFLPNGSPPRPTATATCRPWTWVQHISEGQIEEERMIIHWKVHH